MPRKVIGTAWDRQARNDINDNFEEIYDNTGQYDAFKAADEANKQANYAKGQGDYAKSQGSYAGNQGDYAKNAADNAVIYTNTFHDEDSNKTYNWGLKHRGEHMIFMYEEVN